jgi:biotin-(acetyl-CoA carboxylase) ligase
MVLSQILDEFSKNVALLERPREVAERWENAASLAGTVYRLEIDRPPENIECTARGLGPTGELIVDHNGVRRTIPLADARVLRT